MTFGKDTGRLSDDAPTSTLEAFERATPEELCGTAEEWGVADKAKAAIIKVLTESDVYKQGMAQDCEKEV